MEIRERIRKFRKVRGLSTHKLSELTGISQSTISKIENGKRKTDMEILEKIAEALEVSVERLTGEAASSIIEDKLEEIGMTIEELAERAGVSLHWLQNLDSFIPGELANGEIEYKWITQVAKVLGLPGSQLRAALARQETPVWDGVKSSAWEDFKGVKEDGPEYAPSVMVFESQYLRRIPLVGRIAAGDPILAIENPGEYIVIDTRINKVNGNSLDEYFALEVIGQSMEPTIHDGEIVLVKKTPVVEPGEIGVFRCNGEEATIKRFAREGGKVYLIPDNKQFPVQEYTKDCECIGKVIESIRRVIK